ncbi:MAG: hypothetical protein ACEQSK_09380 [Sphingomonadaceae bacterium]
MNIALIVTDAGPLITLAIADALDTLTLMGTRIIIPDIVHLEVTRHIGRPGAAEILAWSGVQTNQVEIGHTEEFEEYVELLALDPARRLRNRGELAAAEILARELAGGIDAGLLLFEDSDLKKASFMVRIPDRVLLLSTSSFLYGLQRKHLIADAEHILARATAIRGPAIYRQMASASPGAADVLSDWIE